MTKMRRITVQSGEVLNIVSDGLWASRAAEGKGVPVLVFDTTARPDLDAVISSHRHMPPGDVTFGWGYSRDRTHVLLRLHFERPVDATAVVLFEIETQGVLVDAILNARAFYFQGGTADTKFRDDLDAQRILVGVDPLELGAEWDELFRAQMARKYRRHGYPRKAARLMAETFIVGIRNITRLQVPQ